MTTHKLASLKQGLPRSQSFLRLLFPVRNDKAEVLPQSQLSAATASLVAAQLLFKTVSAASWSFALAADTYSF
ncbi:MAG: hypothetical protein PHI48_13040 [Bacteroidales bacterium]|nr:hypothetical protein [Bacteroidales bacterium]